MPEPEFADDAEHLVGGDIEIDAAHRRHRPAGAGEGDLEAAHGEEGLSHESCRRAASSRPAEPSRHRATVIVRATSMLSMSGVKPLTSGAATSSPTSKVLVGMPKDAVDQHLVQMVVGGLDLLVGAERRVHPLDRRDIVGMRVRLAEDRVVDRPVDGVGGDPAREFLDVADAGEDRGVVAAEHGVGELRTLPEIQLDVDAELGRACPGPAG